MDSISRRTFSNGVLGSLLGYTLLETMLTHDLFAANVKELTQKWLKDLNDLSNDLKGKKLSQTDWQAQVTKLMGSADLQDLLKFVDYEKLRTTIDFKGKGEKSMRAKFPEVEGLPRELVFGHQVFGVKKGSSVVPHGHDNMATAFIVMSGDFRGRLYDRLEDTKTHMIIRPTIDETFGPGGVSTISDEKDNVHWFEALSDVGFIFNIHVMDLQASKTSQRVYVDPNGEKLSDGRIKAKRLSTKEAYDTFG